MINKRRIGIYGGTFNPPHSGHVGAAEAFCKIAKLDELIIMPDFIPPHKDISPGVSAEDRLNMSKLAFSHIGRARVSDMEIKRGGRSYTSVTLEEMSAKDVELYFLCGTDMLLTLSEWYRPEVIFKLAVICYARRETDEKNTELIEKKIAEYEEKFSARIIKIPTDVKEISSSYIREILHKRPKKVDFLPENVYDYILKKRLYL